MSGMPEGPAGPTSTDLWERLRRSTPARIGLGRVGHALPLGEVLDFQLAHARARDAVHGGLDRDALARALAPLPVVMVESAASDRATYLRRPDLGRQLAPGSARMLAGRGDGCDVLFVLGDGLSPGAVQARGAALVKAAMRELADLSVGPVVLAHQARVALGDPVGEALGARICVMILGERPGLSVADSLGIYLTYAPRIGRRDSERNCISNIHDAGGLSCQEAARKLGWLVREALRRGLSGVGLKEEAPLAPPNVPLPRSEPEP
ncbi:ethanolamine ammonia-lyase subunit EutC [Novosphingobium sp. KACC 22771]|uniref:ethanolamine ammonia-lyase subunit EutC n=1 Tax=Novosphingobium sp. KACC 22771 TaxID=3025670 RepID=UPI00236590B9|nr:ethanolamine ammonia-lyase subunit EutC [Novosphingobium sp. KACC 22771]WDF72291.1 ethanolamine ammonia-lyase subunit EutC [Novosphingobium sp. KACC 22771]